MNHDGYGFYQFKTCFCEFKSINDIFCLIYSEKINVLACYDIINKKIISRVNKDKCRIKDIRHYLDNQLKRDLILHSAGNQIEVSNLQNWELLLKISDINKGGCLFSSCFFNDNNNIYILTSNNKVTYIWETEKIKVFYMKKNKIKEINNSNEDTLYIDTYYDSKFDNNFIVTCNISHINFYDFKNNTLFKKYNDTDFIGKINDFVVDERGSIKKLLGSSYHGIRIWDFYTGEILRRIMTDLGGINGLCLFGKDYILAGASKKDNGNAYILLIDLINEKIINRINTNQEKQISHITALDIKNGKIFISGGRWSDIIILENKKLEFLMQNRIEIKNFYS